ncbi:hypothetical protein FACS1894147_02970 [Spirochaetia bacterium]|nr:hypothetical protein FACS1894147_02970 [Spirochaetia bacterium]
MYPRAEYLTGRGTGLSRAEAETVAIAEIARIFGVSFSSTARGRETFSTGNGNTTESRELSTETLTRTYTELFSLKYAVPWRNPQTKQWEALAYINRQEAWETYEPEAQKQAGAFTALFEAAENESDPLKRFFAYRAAEQYTASSAYITTLEFGQVLAPMQMNSAFTEVRAGIVTIPQKMNEAKKAGNIFVVVDTDNEGALNAALAKALGGEGFPVARTRAGAAAICAATVTEGLQKSDMGTFYFPKISITLRSANGSDVFSCSIEAAKQGAVNPDIAKLRAYTALAAAIEKQLPVELNK